MILALYDRSSQSESPIGDPLMNPSGTGRVGRRNTNNNTEIRDRADRDDRGNANYQRETGGNDNGSLGETGYQAVTVGSQQKSNDSLTDGNFMAFSKHPLVRLF